MNAFSSGAWIILLANKALELISFCVFSCVLVEDVVVLALSRRPVPPSSGKTLFALAAAPWMQVLKSSLPPQLSGETGTTSFRKKEKKVPGVSSAMELLCPPRVIQWGTEISGRSRGSLVVMCVLFKSFRFVNICMYFGRLPRVGPFVRNSSGIVLCCSGKTRGLNRAKNLLSFTSFSVFCN